MFVQPYLYAAVIVDFKMVYGWGLCLEFLFLRHGFIAFQSCADFRLRQGRAQAAIYSKNRDWF